ncbi:MAG: DUF1134 domain-containing protein [Parasphingorhabdus sp.]|nr:DUF1134 domain-containing protein [Parasphingorhabdus sp.]
MARRVFKKFTAVLALLSAFASVPLYAQVQTVDPNDAINADLVPGTPAAQVDPASEPAPGISYDGSEGFAGENSVATAGTDTVPAPGTVANVDDATTYQQDDLIGAAEGVFGKGAKGLAGVIENILGKQGRPNGYITGREASGAFVVGLRYGSGTLHHKIEGERQVYWTGPSVGFDVGGNAANTFVLVYNLYDSEELYQRFPAGEGAAYFIGGFQVSYLRSGDKVLIPVRLGAGLRLGANIGYMKFSKKQNWVPF